VGSDGHIEQHRGWVFVWVQGMIKRFTAYLDTDKGCAAAKRLVEERG